MYLLEGVGSGLTDLFSGITTVITNVITLFGTVSSTLMNNELFQITIGIIILGIVLGLIFNIIKQIKMGGIHKIDYITSKDARKYQKKFYKRTGIMLSEDEAYDFLIDNLSEIIANGINKSLHKEIN